MSSTSQRVQSGRLQQVLLAVFALILILLPFHAFLSTWGGTAIGPLFVWKSWKEILLVALVPLVIWYCLLRPDVARLVWHSWLTKVAIGYMVLSVFFAIGSHASLEAVAAGMLMNLRFVAMLLLGQLLYFADHPWVRRLKHYVPFWLFAAAIIVSLLAILQVTLLPKDVLTQFGYGPDSIPAYLLIDDQPDALRAFATLRGPNTLGAFLLLPLALALVTVVRQPRNILAGAALGLGSVALVLTGSRSAWLGALAAVAVLVCILTPRHRLLHTIRWGAIPAVIAAGLFFWLAASVPAVRLAVFHSSPGDASLHEGSSTKHGEEVARGVQDAVSHPLGQGIGTAGPASFYNANAPPKVAENYYVQLTQEVGITGLALFVALCVLVVSHMWHSRHSAWQAALLASFAGVTLINLFLHGWADDPTAMTWWGIAGLYVFADNKT